MDFFNFLRNGEKLLDSKILVFSGGPSGENVKTKAFDHLQIKVILGLPDTPDIVKKIIQKYLKVQKLEEINALTIELFSLEDEKIIETIINNIKDINIGVMVQQIKEELQLGKLKEDDIIATIKKRVKYAKTKFEEAYPFFRNELLSNNVKFLYRIIFQMMNPIVNKTRVTVEWEGEALEKKLFMEQNPENIEPQIDFLNYVYPKVTGQPLPEGGFGKLVDTRNKVAFNVLQDNLHEQDVVEALKKELPNLNIQLDIKRQKNVDEIINDLKNEGFTLSETQNENDEETTLEFIPDYISSLQAVKYIENLYEKYSAITDPKEKEKYKNFGSKFRANLVKLLDRYINQNPGEKSFSGFMNLLENKFEIEPNSTFNSEAYQNLKVNVITDTKYRTKTIDSTSEQIIIDTIRRRFNLQCVPSQALIPAPDNEQYSYFKIDFVLYCNVYKDKNLKKEAFLLGEYYGFDEESIVSAKMGKYEEKIKEYNELSKKYFEINEKEPKDEGDIAAMKDLQRSIGKLRTEIGQRGEYQQRRAYQVKTEVKNIYEAFVARQIKADTIQISEPPSNIPFTKKPDWFADKLTDELNNKGVIFVRNDGKKSNALIELEGDNKERPQDISEREAYFKEAKVYLETKLLKQKVELILPKKNFWKLINEAIRDIALQFFGNNADAKDIFIATMNSKKNSVYMNPVDLKDEMSRMQNYKKLVIDTISELVINPTKKQDAIAKIQAIRIPSPDQLKFTPSKLNSFNPDNVQSSSASEIFDAYQVRIQKLDELNNCENIEDQIFYVKVDYIVTKQAINGPSGLRNYNPCEGKFIQAKTFNLKRFAKINVKYKEEKIIPMNEIKKIQLLQNLVKLSQMAEEIENDNPEAAGLIDKSVEEIGNAAQNSTDIRPEEAREDKSEPLPFTEPDNFPRIDNPEIDIKNFQKTIAEALAKEIINDPNISKSNLLNEDFLEKIINKKIEDKKESIS